MEERSIDGSLFPDVVYSRNVIEFATVANEFCTFAESVSDYPRSEFLESYRRCYPYFI